jgi:hydrophobic/amphiphilic exporter-1 (mainly G- bacteria), HAE1 family
MSLPRYSVENPVFVNMMMVVTLIAGAVFAMTLVREMFPESRPNRIAITAVYPATQPEELERAVTIKVEEAVRDVDGVEKVDSVVSEGITRITLTLFNHVRNVDTVLQEVKNEVDALTDLPDDLEKITVSKIEPLLPVIMVSVYGDGDEAALKRAAREIKDDLLELEGISDVEITGLRDDEISVEIRPEKLFEFDVTFDELALAIRETNLDVSGGNLKGDRSQVAVRMLGEGRTGRDLEEIEVRALPDGRVIRVRDVAEVRDQFVDSDVRSYWSGKRAASLIVQKTPAQDAIQISRMVKAYVAGKRGEPFEPLPSESDRQGRFAQHPGTASDGQRSIGSHRSERTAPGGLEAAWARVSAGMSSVIDKVSGRTDPAAVYAESFNNPFRHGFEVDTHTDLARFVEGRLDLLLRNGRAGLVLVLCCLMLFLNWRVAIWTAIGLPVSFLGTFVVMSMFGVTINLLSMFGLIIVLGIIVDDAIVIGENIYRRVEEGMPAREAAAIGAEEVLWPVTVAVMTTIAAFLPLMFIRGQMGDFMRQLPLVVIAALSVSLIEALVILPAHLRHLPDHKDHKTHKPETPLLRLGHAFVHLQQSFLEGLMNLYGRLLRFALRWRYVSLAFALASLMMSLGLFIGRTETGYVRGNIVPWEFIQKMDAESMYAQIELPVGSNASEVERQLRILSDAAEKIPEVKSVSLDVAAVISVGASGSSGGDVQPHLGQIWVELEAADYREEMGMRSSEQVLSELREVSETLTGVNSVKWEVMSGGPGGKDIEIRVSGSDVEEIKQVVEEFKDHLATYDGVVDLDDNYNEGKRELQLTLRESARPTGITRAALGNHVRAATYGAEARRITRNREDVKIMVRYPESHREDIFHIESMWLPTPPDANGRRGWVPLAQVADVTETRGFTQIHRSQQRRAITVFGEIDSERTQASDVIEKVRREFVPEIEKRHPGIRIEFLGSQEEQAKAFGSLRVAGPVALLMVYMMLAALFRSYVQPLVVMSAIPFAIEGAIFGHWVTNNPMTFLSAIGLVALTGIVVNDSLVLVDFVNKRVRAGMSELEASIAGATLRVRPILLTTVTTTAGLTPLMFERSFQAKFLIPMAVTLTFGLVFATVLTLLIVPVLNMIFYDVRKASAWLWGTEPDPKPADGIGGTARLSD